MIHRWIQFGKSKHTKMNDKETFNTNEMCWFLWTKLANVLNTQFLNQLCFFIKDLFLKMFIYLSPSSIKDNPIMHLLQPERADMTTLKPGARNFPWFFHLGDRAPSTWLLSTAFHRSLSGAEGKLLEQLGHKLAPVQCHSTAYSSGTCLKSQSSFPVAFLNLRRKYLVE